MEKLESAMDTLFINQPLEKSSPEFSNPATNNSLMPAYPTDEKAMPYTSRLRKQRMVVSAILSSGNFEQQRMVLHNVLIDPQVINLASSIGNNAEEALVNRNIVCNMKRYLQHAQLSTRGRKSNNKRAALNVICSAIVGTPTRTPTSTTSSSRSKSNVTSPGSRRACRALGISMRSVARERAPSARKIMC